MLAVYLAYNMSHVGIALPISGAAKGDGALLGNGWFEYAVDELVNEMNPLLAILIESKICP